MSLAEAILRPAAACFVVVAGAYYISCFGRDAQRNQIAKSLLPKDDSLSKIDTFTHGTFNEISVVQTKKNCYILRCPTERHSHGDYFDRIYKVTKLVSESGFGPLLVNASLANQALLLEYIPNVWWPQYTENPLPYRATMKTLRLFHDYMKNRLNQGERKDYLPFSFFLDNQQQKSLANKLPHHFLTATQRIQKLLKEIEPWLHINATICHGDLHRDNVLANKAKENFDIRFIDFDTATVGHPYFDVAKFAFSLDKEAQSDLFSTYLDRNPNEEEKKHYQLMHLAVLITMATSWLVKANEAQSTSTEKMTKEQMERLLDSGDPIPEPLSSTPNAYKRQIRALIALRHFFEKSNNLA